MVSSFISLLFACCQFNGFKDFLLHINLTQKTFFSFSFRVLHLFLIFYLFFLESKKELYKKIHKNQTISKKKPKNLNFISRNFS